MEFFAEVIVMKRQEDGKWEEKSLVVRNVNDIKLAFNGDEVTQVNLNKYHKVFYTTKDIERHGSICSKVVDESGDLFFMASPVMLVLCDDEKPISITGDDMKLFKDSIDFL